LENISQEKIEEDVNPETVAKSPDSDIQFEEVIDIDKIQRELREQFGDGTQEDEESVNQKDESSEIDTDGKEPLSFSPPKEFKQESKRLVVDPKDKKYVVYIDYENVDFMEDLSNAERKEMINKILKEQNSYMIKQKVLDDRNRFIKHSVIATITFIVGFPLLFLSVNKAMELTMQNYKEAKGNFSKLYKEQGKIKSDDSAVTNFKY